MGYDFCVGIRLPNEEYIPGGLTPHDVAEIACIIEPEVDYVSLHMGSYWRFHKLLSPMDEPLGSEMPANEVITRVVTKPTMVVGRIMTLDHAEHIVASGAADLVSGTGAHRRSRSGRQSPAGRGAPDPAVHRLQLRLRRSAHELPAGCRVWSTSPRRRRSPL